MSEMSNVPATPFERLVRSRWYGAGGILGLSKLSGVSRATLYSWFRGETTPDAKSLARLSTILDVSTAELVEAIGGEPSQLQPRMAAFTSAAPMAASATRSMVDASGPAGWPQRGPQDAKPPVAWCHADDPIGPVARTMYERHYSQMPVRDGAQWIGLLTTEAIARWMAGRGRNDLEVETRAPVREVLAYADDAGDFRTLDQHAPAEEVLALFDGAAIRGQPLKAILLVNPKTDELTGIVTAYDLPRLRQQAAR